MNNVGAGIVFLRGQQADFLAKRDAIYRSIIDKLGLNVSAASMVHGLAREHHTLHHEGTFGRVEPRLTGGAAAPSHGSSCA